jgi:hypothetical protein
MTDDPSGPAELSPDGHGDWSIVDQGGHEVAFAGSRQDAVRAMGWLAVRDHLDLPLVLLGPGSVPTGDRLG